MRASFLALALAAITAAPARAELPSPSDFLKLKIGDDRVLADYRQIARYFRALDEDSARLEVQVLGKTTLGEDLIMAVISSESNLRQKDRWKQIARRLADPRGLSPQEAEALVREGRAIVLVTCNIHATEIGASQMAMEWAHALVSADDAETKRRLEDVVLLLVPSLNPDGQIMETEWYRKHLGTRYEGGRMPWLYHHYVGHDNNRDWLHLSQKETRAVTRAVYHEWFPQVFIDEHQQEMLGPRMFIPPVADPIDPDLPGLLWREINLIGSHIAFRLEQRGKAGVISHYSYDGYWVGGTRNTAWWKNITGLLFETASVRLASPIYIERNEFETGKKGLIDYKPTSNHPNPWRGGSWRLRDIMDYERIASDAVLEIAADRREDLLRGLYERARSAIAQAAPGEAYRVPARQRDYPTARRLALLLADHGVDVYADAASDFWVPLAHPYSRFVREVLEPQRYPEIRPAPGKDILKPYDVVTWSLPLLMGVEVERATLPAGGVARMRRLSAPIASAAVPRTAAARPRGGAVYAVWPTSPESARVVNAGLKAGGAITRLAAAAGTGPAGTFLLDQKAAEAAAPEAYEAGITLAPLAKSPGASSRLKPPRVGLYKAWAANIDEGWTRYLLEQYGFAPKSLDNKRVRAGKLAADIDVLILPAMGKDTIESGRAKRSESAMKYGIDLPEEYRGGLERDGARAIKDFVEGGGTLVAFGQACDYAIDELNIPVRSALAGAGRAELTVPGSLLRVRAGREHAVLWGMPSEMLIFQDGPLAFETTVPGPGVDRSVLAFYPDDARDILRSGWIEGAERLAGKSAAVAVTLGKGRVVLFGFRPQNRAQTNGTFALVWNAIYWGALGQ